MRNTVAKKLRKITNASANPVNKRVYRRLKKQYNKVPKHARRDFIKATEQFFGQFSEMVEKQSREPVVEEG